MFDLIYNFLHDILFNSSVLPDTAQQNACLLISVVIMVLIVFCLVKLVVWVFGIVGKKQNMRRY